MRSELPLSSPPEATGQALDSPQGSAEATEGASNPVGKAMFPEIPGRSPENVVGAVDGTGRNVIMMLVAETDHQGL